MFRKTKLFFIVLLILTSIFLFSLVASASEIEIRPVEKGQEYYIMNLGEIQTFEVFGFGWDKKKAQKIPEAKVETVQWSFNSRFLELIETKDNTITLKAIKDRTSKLTVTGKVGDRLVTKVIFVVIKRSK